MKQNHSIEETILNNCKRLNEEYNKKQKYHYHIYIITKTENDLNTLLSSLNAQSQFYQKVLQRDCIKNNQAFTSKFQKWINETNTTMYKLLFNANRYDKAQEITCKMLNLTKEWPKEYSAYWNEKDSTLHKTITEALQKKQQEQRRDTKMSITYLLNK